MTRPIAPALLALTLGCALASQAAAQASFQQQIRTALRTAAGSAQGMRTEGEPLMGVLNGRATETKVVELQAGVHYVIVGVCDESCTDLNLRIVGPGRAGVAEDAQPNNTPTLDFTTPAAGRYRLAVEMTTCAANPCAWGVQVLSVRQ